VGASVEYRQVAIQLRGILEDLQVEPRKTILELGADRFGKIAEEGEGLVPSRTLFDEPEEHFFRALAAEKGKAIAKPQGATGAEEVLLDADFSAGPSHLEGDCPLSGPLHARKQLAEGKLGHEADGCGEASPEGSGGEEVYLRPLEQLNCLLANEERIGMIGEEDGLGIGEALKDLLDLLDAGIRGASASDYPGSEAAEDPCRPFPHNDGDEPRWLRGWLGSLEDLAVLLGHILDFGLEELSIASQKSQELVWLVGVDMPLDQGPRFDEKQGPAEWGELVLKLVQ